MQSQQRMLRSVLLSLRPLSRGVRSISSAPVPITVARGDGIGPEIMNATLVRSIMPHEVSVS